MKTYTVIPCPGSRIVELKNLLGALQLEKGSVILISTQGDSLPIMDRVEYPSILEVTWLPWNGYREIAKWWNCGAERARAYATREWLTEWNIFFPGSDVIGSRAGVERLAWALRSHDLSMVGPDWTDTAHPDTVAVYRGPNSHRSAYERVPGACFMLRGEEGLRFDERYPWWYSDDDMEMQARCARGAGIVGGVDLQHPNDHMLDATQARQAVTSRELFIEKWGREPW